MKNATLQKAAFFIVLLFRRLRYNVANFNARIAIKNAGNFCRPSVKCEIKNRTMCGLNLNINGVATGFSVRPLCGKAPKYVRLIAPWRLVFRVKSHPQLILWFRDLRQQFSL